MHQTHRVEVIDSHTGGEPTRVVISGGPALGSGPLSERVQRFRDQFDRFREAVGGEPRGSEALVGALLCEPEDRSCVAGVIFFNNVGYLGMCGHGTIGLGVTLAHLGKIGLGQYRVETPVGIVDLEIHSDCEVTVSNVPSFRHRAGVLVDVEGFGMVRGDVAWGGNWFFLTKDCPFTLSLSNLHDLTQYACKIRDALAQQGVTGAQNAEIDHIELYGPPTISGAHSKNFVLCPGGSYDRSPCGTGTSAKMACLQADGHLQEGQVWRQESLIGSLFDGSILVKDGVVHPKIKGTAYVTGQTSLLLRPDDPFCWGIPRY